MVRESPRAGTALRRPVEAGPPLPLVAAIATGLFVASVAAPVAISGAAYPSPFGPGEELTGYLSAHGDALRLAALLQFAASVPLAVLTASMVARLHALDVRAAGPTIALVGGVLASAATAVSACGQWLLSRTSSTAPPELLRALHDLGFIAGGPWHVVALGLLLAGVAVSAAFSRLLPRPVWVAGVALAGACELATLAFATTSAAYLLPLGRFGGLIWLVTAAVLLPKRRTSR